MLHRRMMIRLDVWIATKIGNDPTDPLLRSRQFRSRPLESMDSTVDLQLRRDPGDQQFLLAVSFASLIVERLAGRGQLSLTLAVARLQRLDLQSRTRQLRFSLLHCYAKRLSIDPEEYIALVDSLIVMDIHFQHATGDVGADRNARSLNICIVGRFITAARQINDPNNDDGKHRAADHQRQA